MITVYQRIDDLSQDSYDAMIKSLDLRHVQCTCGHEGEFQYYGHYKRKIKRKSTTYYIRIQRVRCTNCGITHAIFPSDIIPYNQILLTEQIAIIRLHESGDGYSDFMNSNPEIDENNVASVIRRYDKAWLKELNGVIAKELSDDELVQISFKQIGRQFLQIRTKFNIFVDKPT